MARAQKPMAKINICTALFLIGASNAHADMIIETTIAGKYLCKNTKAFNILNTDPLKSEDVATNWDETLFTIEEKNIFIRYPATGDFAVQHSNYVGTWENTEGQSEYLFSPSKADGWLDWNFLSFKKTSSAVTPYAITTATEVNADGVKFRFYVYECVKT